MSDEQKQYAPPAVVRIPAQLAGQTRVVGAIRLSRYTDASTSPEVQEEMVSDVQRRIGGAFVGWAVDTDISALKTTPWERPQLCHWLDRPAEWDAMVWQRMDRAVRSMADMADLGRYAKEHGKRLIFASGPGGAMLELDFSSPMSELIMLILAFAAQLEGQTIMERNRGAAAYLQAIGRWPGGTLPYGFYPVKRVFPDGREGWWLALHRTEDDPTTSTADIRLQMVQWAIDGKGYSEIHQRTLESGAITPANFRAMLAGRPLDPTSQWRVTSVREMLLSQTMRGYLLKKDGTVVRMADGSPVMQGEVMTDDETWHALDVALKQIQGSTTPRRQDGNDLLGVLVCHHCAGNLTINWAHEKKGGRGKKAKPTGRKIYSFRCDGEYHAEGVPGVTVQVDPSLEFVDSEFLRVFGDLERTRVVQMGGVDHRAEIKELEGDCRELAGRMASLRGVAADVVQAQLQARSDRLAELSATPFEPPRTEVVPMGVTWGADYVKADRRGKLKILLAAGVRVVANPPAGWRRPVSERLIFTAGTGGFADPVAARLAEIEAEEATP
ncbi:recombinase family protein [Streptomyces sp. NPDC088183]|uniref:recombinase family protein n=1 Tax=Streptomyces sp. NPDC088183 TaxID=3160992 RepID=UPI00341E03D0